MNKLKKWTFIDTLIVLVVIVGALVVYKVFGGNIMTVDNSKHTIDITIMVTEQDKELTEQIKPGDTIVLSLTERDSGVLKDLYVEDAKSVEFDALSGKFKNTPVPDKVDIYATVQVDVTQTEYLYQVGSTPLRVGSEIPFRGKGYAFSGYITEIKD